MNINIRLCRYLIIDVTRRTPWLVDIDCGAFSVHNLLLCKAIIGHIAVLEGKDALLAQRCETSYKIIWEKNPRKFIIT